MVDTGFVSHCNVVLVISVVVVRGMICYWLRLDELSTLSIGLSVMYLYATGMLHVNGLVTGFLACELFIPFLIIASVAINNQ